METPEAPPRIRTVDKSIPGRTDVPTVARVLELLTEIIDPELGIDLVNLGLVYGVEVDGHDVKIDLTLTSASCPVGPQILEGMKRTLGRNVPGIRAIDINVVYDPPWTAERMSATARSMMGW
ncbi:MAG: metal-sulfur cluster assembly factor [Candidatus Brocadiae bacterium]|nr:metal-sulfur cluster assembly factor [Candidatus Brocadiia bacterium]